MDVKKQLKVKLGSRSACIRKGSVYGRLAAVLRRTKMRANHYSSLDENETTGTSAVNRAVDICHMFSAARRFAVESTFSMARSFL
jgi:hypothetical protein